MTEQDFVTNLPDFNLEKSGNVSAKSPSNIALVKYWGKTEPQIPTNPSISFTLTNCYTKTTLSYQPKRGKETHIQVFLSKEEKPSFVPKIKKFFERIKNYAPYLNHFDFKLETENSFPHSSGIASSASGMSALAKCLVQMETELGLTLPIENKEKRVSFLSRLGSGSACRSVFSGLIEWGKSTHFTHSSDLYATPLAEDKIHSAFKTFKDAILLIHEGSKSVSSTVGHQLMNNHPYAEKRFKEADKNLGELLRILGSGNLEEFGQLVEHEALSLHAMMLTSNPAFILMKPNTVAVLEKVWKFRKETGNPLFFTLDAGANVHLLYPENNDKEIENFIETELLQHCQNGKAIFDKVDFSSSKL